GDAFLRNLVDGRIDDAVRLDGCDSGLHAVLLAVLGQRLAQIFMRQRIAVATIGHFGRFVGVVLPVFLGVDAFFTGTDRLLRFRLRKNFSLFSAFVVGDFGLGPARFARRGLAALTHGCCLGFLDVGLLLGDDVCVMAFLRFKNRAITADFHDRVDLVAVFGDFAFCRFQLGRQRLQICRKRLYLS